MEEKYQLLNKREVNLYTEGSPVVIAVIAVTKEIATGQIYAQAKFQNVGDRIINAIVFDVRAFDVLGNPVEGVEGVQCLDLTIGKNEYFGHKLQIRLQNPITRNISVHIQGVVFNDGEIWRPENEEWKTLEKSVAVDSVPENPMKNSQESICKLTGQMPSNEETGTETEVYSFHSSKGMKGGWLLGRIVNDLEVQNGKVSITTIPQKYNKIAEFELAEIENIQCKKAISLMGIIRTIVFALLAFVLTPITLIVAALLIIWIDLNDKIIISLKNGTEIVLYSNYRNDTKRFLHDFAPYVADTGRKSKDYEENGEKKKGTSVFGIILIIFGVVALGAAALMLLYPGYCYSKAEKLEAESAYVEAMEYYEKANGHEDAEERLLDCKFFYVSQNATAEDAEQYIQDLAKAGYLGTTDIQEYYNSLSEWKVNIFANYGADDCETKINAFQEYEKWYFHFNFDSSLDKAQAMASAAVEASDGTYETIEFEEVIVDDAWYWLEVDPYTCSAGTQITMYVYLNGAEAAKATFEITSDGTGNDYSDDYEMYGYFRYVDGKNPQAFFENLGMAYEKDPYPRGCGYYSSDWSIGFISDADSGEECFINGTASEQYGVTLCGIYTGMDREYFYECIGTEWKLFEYNGVLEKVIEDDKGEVRVFITFSQGKVSEVRAYSE